MNDNFQRTQLQNDNYSRVKHVKESNGIGTAGFILSIVAIFASSIILWILGTVFSIIGTSRKPKGLAIAGTIISCTSAIIFILMIVFAFVAVNAIKQG